MATKCWICDTSVDDVLGEDDYNEKMVGELSIVLVGLIIDQTSKDKMLKALVKPSINLKNTP